MLMMAERAGPAMASDIEIVSQNQAIECDENCQAAGDSGETRQAYPL